MEVNSSDSSVTKEDLCLLEAGVLYLFANFIGEAL